MKKELNNKGFTLIELLAVVVILAVVMGIATTSVLSAMNKAKGGSLQDTAMIIAKAFKQKYAESLVDGVPSNVYGDVLIDTLDDSGNAIHNGYSFQSDAIYYIHPDLASIFNISSTDYAFTITSGNTVGGLKVNKPTNWTDDKDNGVKSSFVSFDVDTGEFLVCMFANRTGKYYVDNYKTTDYVNLIEVDGKSPVPWSGKNTMYACSDGTKSW